MSFAHAITTELKWLALQTPDRTVSSIFFGGGTPSLMPPSAVSHVLDEIAALWTVAPHAEITLEANPTSVEATNFRGYRSAGINRVSVGVQALDEKDLAALGRQHSPDEALAAFRLAATIFPRVSFDMIYARPNQTRAAWTAELTRALGEQQGHMSLYQLTIEPDTRFADLFAMGKLQVPEDDLAADLYDITQELTARHGLATYEVSNHAKAGHESQHNLLYWRYGEYAGAGPGAHSRLRAGENRVALATEKHPETWRQLVQTSGHGIAAREIVEPAAQAREMMLMGLRVAEGISLSRYEKLSGEAVSNDALDYLSSLGLISRNGDKLCATQSGRRILNAVIEALVV